MAYIIDLHLWFFVFAAAVWTARANRALQTLHMAPVVRCKDKNDPFSSGKVSVIIPAKNEEKNIGHCLEGLLIQDYPNYEIIVVNDNSTDRTADILMSYEDRIKVINAPTTPDDWTGKNHAIDIGLRYASGDWFLFTDADTVHEPASISSAMSYAQQRDIFMLTLTPRCLAYTFVEKLIQPCAMALIGLWFPIEKVNDMNAPEVFGNGQYILMEKKMYHRTGGHEAVKDRFLEDFALVKAMKEMQARFQCAIGTDIYGTRMYQTLPQIWRGWRRIFLHGFDRNAKRLLAHFANLIFFSVLPFTVFFVLLKTRPDKAFVLGIGAVVLIFILGTAVKAYSILRARKKYALLYPLAALVIAMILLDSFWMALSGKKTVWR